MQEESVFSSDKCIKCHQPINLSISLKFISSIMLQHSSRTLLSQRFQWVLLKEPIEKVNVTGLGG